MVKPSNPNNIEEICRHMCDKKCPKKDLEEYKKLLQAIPLDKSNIRSWCKCYFLSKKLNSMRANIYKEVFLKKVKGIIDSRDTDLLDAVRKYGGDPEIQDLLPKADKKPMIIPSCLPILNMHF